MPRHNVVITSLRTYPNGAVYARGLVESESRPGVWYEVKAIIDKVPLGGTYWLRITGKCTCPAARHSRMCKHIIWLANHALERARKGQVASPISHPAQRGG